MPGQTEIYSALLSAARDAEPVALGVISGVKGSSPQKTGAKALFYPDSRIAGTLGGGCLEAEVQRRAIQALRTGQPAEFDLLLDNDFGWDDGLICGGRVHGIILPNIQKTGPEFWEPLAHRREITHWGINRAFELLKWSTQAPLDDFLYQETVSPPWAFWIAGAGHIARAVAPLACALDFSVTVFDDRPSLLNHNFFPSTVCLRADTWENLVSEHLPERPAFGLIVTRGHRHDALVLRSWIHRPFRNIGMIGSQRKARIIFEHFMHENIATPEQWSRVLCPVGLPIGSKSVMEIAVSIMAQFIEKRAGAPAPAARFPQEQAVLAPQD